MAICICILVPYNCCQRPVVLSIKTPQQSKNLTLGYLLFLVVKLNFGKSVGRTGNCKLNQSRLFRRDLGSGLALRFNTFYWSHL
jgi:hypothetical protein